MMNRLAAVVIFFLSVSVIYPAFTNSPGDDIKKKQSQLEKIRKEIDKYEERIKESEKKERSTLDLLSTYDRQSTLLRRLISRLHDQEVSLRNDIDETRKTIGELSGQLSYLKHHYANYVTTVYKYGHTYDLELLLSANSFNQLLVRSEYLKRFSDQRKKDLDRIDTRRSSLQEQDELLQKQLFEQKELITEKQKEESRFAAKSKKRKAILVDIRRDKKNFKRELERRKQDVKEIERIIAKLIEEEIARRKTEAAPETGSGFAARRGRLPWPVAHGKVTARFGSQQHPTLHTVTQNTGIDIAVPAGTDVRAVAEGEVSKIHWLPSFGNLIILNHNNGFRTVYAHLSEITVNEGDKVNDGGQLGKSGESISGSILHFEIYRDREKQDPEQWLAPRTLSQR